MMSTAASHAVIAATASDPSGAAPRAQPLRAAANRDSTPVFVYGTLKKGFYNNSVLVSAGARFRGAARTRAPMRMVLGEYGIPYLMDPADVPPERGATGVLGELWEVNGAGLDALDVLEGLEEGMYRRVEVDVLVWWAEDEAGPDSMAAKDVSDPAASRGERAAEEVVTVYGYVTGPASLARGVGSADCRVIDAYSMEIHEAEYVPKHERAAGSLGTRGITHGRQH